jgi:iron(III) transport system permease protein
VTRWRLAVVLALLLVVGVPLAQPLLDLASRPGAWETWAEADRLGPLAWNTILLAAGTLALALPAGALGAVVLYRTDLPLRRLFHFLTVLTLFVPLSVLTSAWQAALGAGGWLPVALWGERPSQPWGSGLPAAVWVHAQAALPWVVLIVGQGLCWVEAELEEDALLAAGPWRVLWHVTLPRAGGAIVAAALWVALQAAGEIAVTDMMEVRTFAEETYTQLGMGGGDGLARAVAASVPAVALTCLGLVLVVPRLQRALPPLQTALAPPRPFRLGRLRWPLLAAVSLAVAVLAGVPLVSLTWKAGLQGWPPAWSPAQAGGQVLEKMWVEGRVVALSLVCAVFAGGLTSAFALLLCWLAAESRWVQAVVLTVLAVAWTMPGPVAGIGLKDTIMAVVVRQPHGLFTTLFYEGPSPLPVIWAQLLRFLPYAAAVLWPVVRLLPHELRDAARVDGATPGRELLRVVVPLTLRPLLGAVLVVTALALGEVGAGKPVGTPGMDTFTVAVFDRMHNGVTGEVASLCLLLLAFLVLAGAEVAAWSVALSPRRDQAGADRADP